MEAASWLLLGMAVLGGADVLLFHSISHGLRRHPLARVELVPHALRGPTYLVLFLSVPNLRLDGTWFAALLAALVFDLALSIWDFAVEGRSRRTLGGLTGGEYVLHVLLAMLFGALVATIWILEGHRLGLATRIAYEPADVPVLVRALLVLAGVMTFASGILDLRAVLRLKHVGGVQCGAEHPGDRGNQLHSQVSQGDPSRRVV